MLINIVRRFKYAAALGLCLPSLSAIAADGYLPPTSAFRNIGYNIQDPAPASSPAPVVDHGVAAPMEAVPMEAAPVMAPPPASAAACCPAPAPACQPACCTEEKKKALAAAAKGAHKGVFYANDFSYLSDPCYDGHLLGDSLKRLGGDGFTVDLGGQYRARMHREENHNGLGITGRDDDFLLHRIRLYMNAEIGDNIRFFAETLHADSNYEDFGPRPIEENHFDLQNLFVDLTLLSDGDSKLVARAGRQEIALGAQRYVSPLDWANTRRTFDGGRLMYTGSDWNIDGFWLAPTIRDFRDFDESNENAALYGVYATNKSLFDNGTLDLYWLAFDNENAGAQGFFFDSLGARYNGKLGGLLFETEGAYQFGQNTDGTDHDGGFFMAGLGKAFTEHSCKPTAWVYFDWASGDDEQAAGKGHHHFQPLAHKYNGFMDLYGRRNLIDFNIFSTLQIAPKVKAVLWYHNFWLENENDTPYSVTMAPQQAGVTPTDSHLGNELDFVLQLGITPRSGLALGYSRFWAGEYYNSPGLLTADGAPLTQDNASANFFWAQYTLNF